MSLHDFILHGSDCPCGKPLFWHPDADVTRCALHCDHAPHVALHPSRVCAECMVLGVVGTPERLP